MEPVRAKMDGSWRWGERLGLSKDELAFYDALDGPGFLPLDEATKNQTLNDSL